MNAGRDGEPTANDEGLGRFKSAQGPSLVLPLVRGSAGKRNGLRKFCGPISTLIAVRRTASILEGINHLIRPEFLRWGPVVAVEGRRARLPVDLSLSRERRECDYWRQNDFFVTPYRHDT